ncbi:DegV family protein [Dyella sp. A6]|uniref:DegV family protein n=1 Tax=Dyella aluminiiresistens TaxID=3069105 RepID=UPI002E75A2A6|nr:DegV family protein [Dyella sp. A6]
MSMSDNVSIDSAVKLSAVPRRLRSALIVDAACDLPDTFFKSPHVAVMPITVRIDNTRLIDQHDPRATAQFLSGQFGDATASAETIPMSEREISAMFLERFVLDYDSVYCLTVSSSRSPIYDHAMRASAFIGREARVIRQNAEINRPFQLRVVDTKTAFAAQGVIALALDDMLKRGVPPFEIRTRLFEVIDSTCVYVMPDDLQYMRARARAKGDRSISFMNAMVGSALDIKPVIRGRLGETGPVAKIRGRDPAHQKLFRFVARQVQRGLNTPHMVVSYGSSLEELRSLSGYSELVYACANEGVTLHESVMSITGMLITGKKSISIGFAAPEHAPDF